MTVSLSMLVCECVAVSLSLSQCPSHSLSIGRYDISSLVQPICICLLCLCVLLSLCSRGPSIHTSVGMSVGILSLSVSPTVPRLLSDQQVVSACVIRAAGCLLVFAAYRLIGITSMHPGVAVAAVATSSA